MAQNDPARAARTGDRPFTFETTYDRHHATVLNYLYLRIGDSAAAEELAAEVFARLLHKFHAFHNDGRSLRIWLHIVARNLAVDYLRRSRRLRWLPLDCRIAASAGAYPPEIAERHVTLLSLQAALTCLTDVQRQVITLKFIEGYSNAEIGAILGKDENAVKSLQHRALATLRRILERQHSI